MLVRLVPILAIVGCMGACGSPPGGAEDAAAAEDAAIADSGARDARILDAALADGGAPDADARDAIVVDAGPVDAHPPGGPGERCGTAPNWCQTELECWVLLQSSVPICTKSCIDASECTDPGYGVDPCCAPPGTQTLETVCIPRADPACESQD